MSSSLPRIKTVQELGKHQSQHNAPPLKFRKLTLDPAENGQQRKKSVKVLKTQRLKSLERYSTVQEQRQYKNQKIHLNLIERKLLNGTYDEKKETGNELNSVKHKRDSMKVEINMKTREIQRYKYMLQDVRREIQELVGQKGGNQRRIGELKVKWEEQSQKTVAARENQGVYEDMFKIRHDINLHLCKRHNDMKEHLGHLKSVVTLLDTELREITQRCALQEVKTEQLLKKTIKDRNERNEHISKHQNKINKRKEDEILHSEKSKQYVAHLDQMERINQMKQFHTQYDKILYNVFVNKFLSEKMGKENEHFQKYQYSYRKVCSYKSFDEGQPKELVKRFFQHDQERNKSQVMIKEREGFLSGVQKKNQELKKQYENIMVNLMENSQKLESSLNQLSSESRKHEIQTLKQEAEEAELKSGKVKRSLLKMLNTLSQRGDKRLSGHEPAVNNINQLVSIVKELAKECQK